MLGLCRLSALLAALTLATPRTALAHLHLRGSRPAAGAHLSTAPREIRLTFSEAPQLALSAIALTAPDGSLVPLGTLATDPAAPGTLVAAITGPLVAGTYTVAWSTASADGHPVRGRYTFVIAPGAAGLAREAAPAEPRAGNTAAAERAAARSQAAPTSGPASFDSGSPLYVAVRWLGYAALLGLVGSVVFALFVAPRAEAMGRAGGGAVGASDATGAAARIGAGAAVLLGLATLARLAAQSYAVHGANAAWHGSLIWTMLTRTVWGWGWMLEAVATILAIVAMARALRGRGAGWPLGAMAAVALTLALALSGHAVAVPHLAVVAILADMMHILGAGGWLGTLLIVVVVGIPLALRRPEGERGRAAAAMVNAFSPVALACAALLACTGVIAAWMHLGTLPAIWTSDYGRVLLLKLGVIAAMAALGAVNWRVLRPALGDVAAARRIRTSAMTELAVGALVLAVTAVLVATPPPGEAGTRPPVASRQAPGAAGRSQ